MKRRETKEIKIGNRIIGGNNPILVQSMTNTKTENIPETLEQIHRLEEADCDIVRVAVPNLEAAHAIKEIKKEINIPIVADIHFRPDLVLESIKNGADKVRINPGNIGGLEATKPIIELAGEKNIPIRIGVNSGSIEKELLEKIKSRPKALVESALKYLEFFEKQNFNNLVFSLKASSVLETIEANREFAKTNNYPIHLGVTEAGLPESAIIKSAIGIGGLLSDGIGDTLRVSITGDIVNEVETAYRILDSLDLSSRPKINLISCPTCGRTNIDLIKISNEVNNQLKNIDKDLDVAVMGCIVNGPGEAKEADIGIAGGNGKGVLFKKGQILKEVPEDQLIDSLLDEIEKI